jgi:hypothetical protein
VEQSKKCCRCSKEFPLTNEYFAKDKRSKDGFFKACKPCDREYNRKYGKAHKQKILADARKKYWGDPEGHRQELREWEAANLDKDREWGLRRERLIRQNFIEKVELEVLYERDKGTCQLCMKQCGRVEWSMDHIIPLTKGGEHSYKNTQLAHRSCNASKRDKLV